MKNRRLQRKLLAYPLGLTEGWDIVPAPHKRSWMDATPNGFAYRCLPLTIANQAGWVVRCPADFSVSLTGGGLSFHFSPGGKIYESQITSHFGTGIVTFAIPYLFRTPANVGLLARGMPNEAKFNCAPLEGFVETDWSTATFTMNWRIQRPNIEVTFSRGEPICFLQPYDLRLAESLVPTMEHLSSDETLLAGHRAWAESRAKFNSSPDSGADWQKHYFKGRDVKGTAAPAHRTRVVIAPFPTDATKSQPRARRNA